MSSQTSNQQASNSKPEPPKDSIAARLNAAWQQKVQATEQRRGSIR